MPKEYSSSGVLKEIDLSRVKGKKFLIPQSEIGRDEHSAELIRYGAIVHSVPVYDIAIPDLNEIENAVSKMENSFVDVFIFTSPSTFNNFIQIFKIEKPTEYFKDKVVAAIGPTTKNSIESFGVDVIILPTEHTIEGLVNSIIKYFENKY
jgi:uroporphyrinogen-III synthase